ncbi:MAG: hypothetical protein M1268_04065, partial [Patescibacteria group bacterium]|nr:hypothetical protein [Patescibacteria group bacterium]
MPTQFGKHFWPGFSFVSGIRIDYLSPTLYFTDILIFLLFVLFLLNSKKEIISKLFNWKVLLFALVLLVGIIFSKNQPAGLYGLLKFFEFFFFGFYISRKLKTIKDFETLTLVLSIGVIFESILAAFQFLNQRSLSGILYYLGERNFNGQTPGIANASISGKLILRPYGTFSHPNVLAGYLIIVSMIIISNFNPSTSLRTRFQISNAKKMFYIFSLVVSSIALFLTMGRVAIIAWLAIVIFMAFDYLKNRIKNISTIYYLLFV